MLLKVFFHCIVYKINKSEDKNVLYTGLQRHTAKSNLCFFCCKIQSLFLLLQNPIFCFFCCILGGFSMGGGMAMHLAYRFHQDLAGVFALSSFLNKDSAVFQVSVW